MNKSQQTALVQLVVGVAIAAFFSVLTTRVTAAANRMIR